MFCVQTPVLIPGWFDFAVAVAAVNRPVTAGFKGYFGLLATLGAYHRKHLASAGAIAAASEALFFPCLAACGTALRLIGVASGLEELLFLNAEGEGDATIGTLDRLVLETH